MGTRWICCASDLDGKSSNHSPDLVLHYWICRSQRTKLISKGFPAMMKMQSIVCRETEVDVPWNVKRKSERLGPSATVVE